MIGNIPFDPDRLKDDEESKVILVKSSATGIAKQQIRFWLERPAGDWFALLCWDIADRLKGFPSVDKKIRLGNWQNIILGVAARERVMPSEEVRMVELYVQAWELQPEVNLMWRSLRLYRAVARFADAVAADIPPVLRNEKKAWAQSILRAIDGAGETSIKRYSATLSAIAKQLADKQNPFDAELSPEDFAVVKAALGLTVWSKEIEAAICRLPNPQRKDCLALRRDVIDALEQYKAAFRTAAQHYRRQQKIALTKRIEEKTYLIGNKNKLTQLLDPPKAN